jgi:hypothetical protein
MNNDLESFLHNEVKKLVSANEPTLFAVGGRGYYENPTTDLLKFFLNPDAKHGLGDLFLSSYLECMKKSHLELNTKKGVDVQSQVITDKGNFIDLQITGPDWCLIIENKIRHWDANDFTDYENHANRPGKQKPIFSILSPNGRDKHNNGTCWVGVSYKNYLYELLGKMPELDSYNYLSKWKLFAREFILHLKNELYPPPMTHEEAAKVEKYANQIAEAEKLAWQYREFIRQELKLRLEAIVDGNEFGIHEDWRDFCWLGFRCTSRQWNDNANNKIYLFSPGTGGKFFVQVYLADMSEPQLSNATLALNIGPVNSGGYWKSSGYDSREEAIVELCKLAKIVNGLIK